MESSVTYRATAQVLTLYPTEAKILDEAAIEQMHGDVVSLLEKAEQPNVLFDFRMVKFMSSAALGMLIRIGKKCKELDLAVKVCSVSNDLQQVFQITRMDKVFDIYDDGAAALAAFAKEGRFVAK